MADDRKPGRMCNLAALVVAIQFAAACSASGSSPSPSPSPVRADDAKPPYELTFVMPQTQWQASDVITGEATLSIEGQPAVIGTSGSGVITFGFDEIGGQQRHFVGTETADCSSYRIAQDSPISSPIRKVGGGYPMDAPPSDFNRWFYTDPQVHLPAGDWKITAYASFSNPSCNTADYVDLKAVIVVHVTS